MEVLTKPAVARRGAIITTPSIIFLLSLRVATFIGKIVLTIRFVVVATALSMRGVAISQGHDVWSRLSK